MILAVTSEHFQLLSNYVEAPQAGCQDTHFENHVILQSVRLPSSSSVPKMHSRCSAAKIMTPHPAKFTP